MAMMVEVVIIVIVVGVFQGVKIKTLVDMKIVVQCHGCC